MTFIELLKSDPLSSPRLNLSFLRVSVSHSTEAAAPRPVAFILKFLRKAKTSCRKLEVDFLRSFQLFSTLFTSPPGACALLAPPASPAARTPTWSTKGPDPLLPRDVRQNTPKLSKRTSPYPLRL